MAGPEIVLVGGLLVLGAVADEEGLFAAAAARVERLPGSPRMLFVASLALVAGVTAVLNLDTAVLATLIVLLLRFRADLCTGPRQRPPGGARVPRAGALGSAATVAAALLVPRWRLSWRSSRSSAAAARIVAAVSRRTETLQVVSRFAPPLALMAVIYALSAQPDLNSGLGAIDFVGRKLIHMTEYGLLFLLWLRALRWRSPLAAAVIAVAYSATDEFHQTFVEGRHGTPVDVLIDSLGIAVAYGVWRWSRLQGLWGEPDS